MTQEFYGRAWNDQGCVMGGPISEDEARKRYADGSDDDWFSVVSYDEGFGPGDLPDFTLEVVPRASFISTTFYDQACRFQYRFSFTLQDNGMLFRDEITQFTYPDDNVYVGRSGCLKMTRYTYEPDGSLRFYQHDRTTNMVETMDYRDIDVSSHWEKVPTFGDWESIGRFNREGS